MEGHEENGYFGLFFLPHLSLFLRFSLRSILYGFPMMGLLICARLGNGLQSCLRSPHKLLDFAESSGHSSFFPFYCPSLPRC